MKKLNDPDEWLRAARRVMVNRPATIGLIPAGEMSDAQTALLALGAALCRLTGQVTGIVPAWRRWAESGTALSAEAGTVLLTPPAELDPFVAASTLEHAVGRARSSFAHVLADLSGLPLRHPSTLATFEAFVTVAPSGAVREETLMAHARLLPTERNLGVLLVD